MVKDRVKNLRNPADQRLRSERSELAVDPRRGYAHNIWCSTFHLGWFAGQTRKLKQASASSV